MAVYDDHPVLYSKEYLILVAKTSFGKSPVMQILPCLVLESIIIVVGLPLLALGSEQANSKEPVKGRRGMFVMSFNKSTRRIPARM